MSNNHMSPKEFLIGATIGSLLGSASAFLLAPKTGKKLRRDICDLYDDLSDKTQEMAGTISKKGKCFTNGINGCSSDWSGKAKSLVSELANCVNCFKKEEVAEESYQTKDFIIGAVAGGLIGALAGLILAPKPGDKLRDDLVDSYNDVSDRTQEFAEQIQKKGKYVAKNAKKRANKWLDLAKNVIEEFVDGAEGINENVTEKVKDFADAGRDRVGHVLEWAALGLRVWKSLNEK